MRGPLFCAHAPGMVSANSKPQTKARAVPAGDEVLVRSLLSQARSRPADEDLDRGTSFWIMSAPVSETMDLMPISVKRSIKMNPGLDHERK